MDELTNKLGRLRNLAASRGLEGILLQRVDSTAWITCGAVTYVNRTRTDAEVTLLVTARGHILFTNNIEAVRLDQEEHLTEQGWEFRVAPWYESNPALEKATRGLNLGCDGLYPHAIDLGSELAHLRADLTPEESDRFRMLGRLCAQGMDAAVRSVLPGQTEYEIAARLAEEVERLGVEVTVNLVATDRRAFEFRHPLPTGRKLERYAMLVLCGRRYGLVCSITRLVHFGRLPDEIRRKAEAVARIDAVILDATRPGRSLKDIFQCAMEGYAEAGYPEEWRLHHQGGVAGYEPREYLATPSSTELVTAGQVYAWNPTITGVKSEDSILVGDSGNEILTAIPGWPSIKVDLNGQTLKRPAILVID
jgi:Xaa-Pro aminopeptidase